MGRTPQQDLRDAPLSANPPMDISRRTVAAEEMVIDPVHWRIKRREPVMPSEVPLRCNDLVERNIQDQSVPKPVVEPNLKDKYVLLLLVDPNIQARKSGKSWSIERYSRSIETHRPPNAL